MSTSFYLANNLRQRASEIRRKFTLKKPQVHRVAPEETAGTSELTSGPTPRRRHKSEVPFIKPSEYGNIRFEFNNPGAVGFVDENKKPMTLTDLFEHLIVFGGSGTGKTYSILNPLWEEFFRSTHLPDGPEREEKKFGGLVIEAKGDFRDKNWTLAQKYGRMDDCVYFGPTHKDKVYDMFGDPTELALQKANKLLELLKAFSQGDGGGGQDPFWNQAALKLFFNIFVLHKHLTEAKEEGQPVEVELMSFQLLNLLLMDRGKPMNAGDLLTAKTERDAVWAKYEAACRGLETACKKIEALLRIITPPMEIFLQRAKKAQDAYEEMVKSQDGNEGKSPEEITKAKERRESLRAEVVRSKEIRAAIEAILEPIETEPPCKTFSDCLVILREQLRILLLTDDSKERGRLSRTTFATSEALGNAVVERIKFIAAIDGVEGVKGVEDLQALFETAKESGDEMRAYLQKLSKMKIPEAEIGRMQELVAAYEGVLERAGKKPMEDPCVAYFRGEYFVEANEKTIGSVAMVASNMVALFVHPPFSQIFAPGGSFNFNSVIDKGQIVYLDMPTAKYRATATLAMLVMKIDFFRAMLTRARLQKRNEDGTMSDEIVNQVRPMTYFCDEFASVVTTGDETGEAGFMDKVREFKCACLLGTQSHSTLLQRIKETDVDAILTNTAITIFLRNKDIKTNDYAGKMLGQRVKVTPNLSQGAMESFMSDGAKAGGGRGYSTTYAEVPKYTHDDFNALKKGQAIVSLNPRFGKNQVQKLSFKGKDIPAPDNSPGWGVPLYL